MTLRNAERQSNEPIRVAIIEDDRATREGLGMLINGTPGYACVGAFRSVEDALRLMENNVPDVLLLRQAPRPLQIRSRQQGPPQSAQV